MKADIHPEYKEITIVRTDGSEFVTRSTYGKDRLVLDIDPLNHAAWTGGRSKLKETGRLARFKNRYDGLDSLGKKDNSSSEE